MKFQRGPHNSCLIRSITLKFEQLSCQILLFLVFRLFSERTFSLCPCKSGSTFYRSLQGGNIIPEKEINNFFKCIARSDCKVKIYYFHPLMDFSKQIKNPSGRQQQSFHVKTYC